MTAVSSGRHASPNAVTGGSLTICFISKLAVVDYRDNHAEGSGAAAARGVKRWVNIVSNHTIETTEPTKPGVSRRKVMAGAAWAVPTIVVASAAPAFAASPRSCSAGTLDWDRAPKTNSKVVSGTMVPISLANGTTVYARVTFPTDGTAVGSTGTYHRTVGKTAWGSAVGVYGITTTSGSNSLVLNQRTNTTTTVKLDFFKDAAGTQPITVFNVRVPLDDFSTARSWDTGIVVTSKSYQEAWSVQGTTATGTTVTPTATGLTSPYNATSTLANVRGSGTPTSPWYFPYSLTTSSRNAVGGNLQTSFGTTGLRSITVTYGGNEPSFSGSQGSAIGDIAICA